MLFQPVPINTTATNACTTLSLHLLYYNTLIYSYYSRPFQVASLRHNEQLEAFPTTGNMGKHTALFVSHVR